MIKLIFFFVMSISLSVQSDISNNPKDWYGVTDRVMGGKSNLQVEFVEETFILRGNVTTQNNGGFVRLVQDIKLNDDALSGISFLARGNDEVYEIHATLKGVKMPPWSYMSHSFQVTDEWKRYEIYFKDLKSSGYSARKMKPKNINNIAFAGYGRDFDVNLMVKDISIF